MQNGLPRRVDDRIAPELFVFDTHPIQYRSPIFREMQENGFSFKVYYFNEQFEGNRWWFYERDKIPKQDFGLELREGFPNEILREESLASFFRRIWKLLETHRPKAILIFGYYLPEHWMLWWAAGSLRIPILFIGETFDKEGPPLRRLIKFFLRPLFFSRVSGIVTIGTRTFRFYRHYGVPESKLTRARYCIDTSFFHLPKDEAAHIRKKWREKNGVPQDAFTILFVARLFHRKRPFDVIELHRKLAGLAVHTVIVGSGELEEEVKRVAEGTPRVHFLGFQNQTALREAYYGSDLLFLPSEYETWGLVVNEAFATGLPAVVTDRCGASGDLVDDSTGGVFPMGDIDGGVAQILKFLKDPERHKRARETAYQRVSEEFGVAQFAGAIKTAFQKALV